MKKFFSRNSGTVGLLAAVVAFCGFVYFIYAGYTYEIHKVTNCRATASAWTTAEFSETTVEVCTTRRSEQRVRVITGERYTHYYTESYPCERTNYWSEVASHTATLVTVNGEFDEPEMPFTVRGMAAIPNAPRGQWEGSRRNFDRYKARSDRELIVTTTDGGGKQHTAERPFSENEQCVNNLGRLATITHWYGRRSGGMKY